MDVSTARSPNEITQLGDEWFAEFTQNCSDIYPGRFTRDFCRDQAAKAVEIRRIAAEKQAMIVSHYYQDPVLLKVADFVGDSLGLARKVLAVAPPILHFSSVHFMGETAACMLEGKTQVMVQGDPDVHSCSLVRGTSHAQVQKWKEENPGGVLVTYINSDLLLKTMSDYICTSSNAAEVLARAYAENPGSRILLLPDQYLGAVMKLRAHAEYGVPTDIVDIYEYKHVEKQRDGLLKVWNAACYVHENISDVASEEALDKYPDAIILLHPECGCANKCALKIQRGELPKDRIISASTKGMLDYVRKSPVKTFVVGTETGMIYTLRKECPDREFHPISVKASCGFMKANTVEKLLDCVRNDRIKLMFDDNVAVGDDRIQGDRILINRKAAAQARLAIERMISTGS